MSFYAFLRRSLELVTEIKTMLTVVPDGCDASWITVENIE